MSRFEVSWVAHLGCPAFGGVLYFGVSSFGVSWFWGCPVFWRCPGFGGILYFGVSSFGVSWFWGYPPRPRSAAPGWSGHPVFGVSALFEKVGTVPWNPRLVWGGKDLVPPLPWAGTPPTIPGGSSLAWDTPRDGAATAPLGIPCQPLPTLPARNSFPISPLTLGSHSLGAVPPALVPSPSPALLEPLWALQGAQFVLFLSWFSLFSSSQSSFSPVSRTSKQFFPLFLLPELCLSKFCAHLNTFFPVFPGASAALNPSRSLGFVYFPLPRTHQPLTAAFLYLLYKIKPPQIWSSQSAGRVWESLEQEGWELCGSLSLPPPHFPSPSRLQRPPIYHQTPPGLDPGD
ncbi:uncharacterized protein LOC127464212 [Manacus candei]|uniref:uncharacterized protein LOC127464212 n=1 Tax=Manacus candei TaxID=415023 RepID=UPI002227CF7B|nr:uncharacterized protein LOC127464212 [Manacus candei]